MRYSFLFLILFLFPCCDCIQQVEGDIIDDNSELLLQEVSIYALHDPEKVLAISNESGFFSLEKISGGLGGCPDLDLIFKKDRYKTLEMNFPSFSTKPVLIRMIKDDKNFDSIRSEVMDTVRNIEMDNYISNGIGGRSNKPPKQFIRCQWLINQATNDELLLLMNYPNGAVQVTAFEGLCERAHPETSRAMIQLSMKKSRIHYQAGCIRYGKVIGEYAYLDILGLDFNGQVRPPRPQEDRHSNLGKLVTQKEQQIIIQNLLSNRKSS